MKIALVTGALGGIGRAICDKFLSEGYTVLGMSRSSGEKAKSVISHPNFHFVSGDVSSTSDRELFIKTAIEKFGKIDVLVNVAGVAPNVRADLLEMSEESYDRVMNINTKGTMFLTQLAANEMIKNQPENGIRAYICNISSLSAYTSSVNRGEYCISKAGMSMITTLFADRLAEYGIPVNEVRPGIIETDMTSTVKPKYDALIENGLLPIKRWGQPEDVASAVLSLCSGSISYVTGQAINVDGGFHLRRL